ncbi:MAG: cytochrome c3 family protein [Acidobacteriota bacterium]
MFRKQFRRGIHLASLALCLGLPFDARAQESETCLECHGDASLVEDPDSRRLYTDPAVLEASSHGFLGCVDCHTDLAGVDPVGHDSELAPVDCSVCHPDVQAEYSTSLHAYALERGNTRAPGCTGCHGSHEINLPDELGPKRLHIVDMCGRCHGDAGLLTDELVRLPAALQGYVQSVHGQALRRGIETAAVCSDCHGSHGLRGSLDPESRIHPLQVSATCGQCHQDIQQQYDQSIHGRALRAGITDSPTCNTCHGEHLVLAPSDRNSTTHAARLAHETCGRCHEDSRIIAKYGLADYVVETYVDSYHGWATRWDSPDAATCVRCHTAHWVLPTRDPKSTIHPDNVVATCRQCHADADAAFAVAYTHKTASPSANPVTQWIHWAYQLLIPAVIGGMLLHNAVIFLYYLLRKRKLEREEGTVLRLDRNQIVQHLLLAVSFTVLVITGFALRYPDAFWVQPLAFVGMTESVRSTVHRVAAIVLLAAGFHHILYILLSRRGRSEWLAMIPRWRDAVDVVHNMGYYLGWRREKVRFGRYDYAQKAEYWALVWGTVVMAASGFVLWYPSVAVKIFPTWVVQASELLHFYEAWLAMLAIIVWHFFFTILHPDAYPMSWIWLTGRMSRHEAKEHHREWYEQLIREEEEQAAPSQEA